LGREQLARYPAFLNRRKEILQLYRNAIARLADAEAGFSETADFLFRCTLRTDLNLADVQSRFLDRGVHVKRGVDELLHRRCGLDDDMFPVATRLFDTTVSVPFYPSLSDAEARRVVSAMLEIFGEH
jgi:dTDP-4-amino-4,6-dideoxygalactose transaminase